MKTIIRRIIKILIIVFALSMVFLAAANVVVWFLCERQHCDGR